MPTYEVRLITRVKVHTDEKIDLSDTDEVSEVLVSKAQDMVEENDRDSNYIEHDYEVICDSCWSDENCECID